jgi:lysozyme
MITSERGITLIKSFEGFAATPYLCPGGYYTIGYGHVIQKDEIFSDTIDHSIAIKLLKKDVKISEMAVLRFIDTPLHQSQFDALVSFTFNLGAGALQRSTLRRKINRNQHDDVPNELMRWVYSGGKKLAGLVRRRQAESLLYSSVFS